MKFKIVSGDASKYDTKLLLVGAYTDGVSPALEEVDKALRGTIKRQAAAYGFTGKAGETLDVFTDKKIPAERVLVLGLGKRRDLGFKILREALTSALRKIKAMKIPSITVALWDPETFVFSELYAQTVAEYAGMVDYVINHYKTKAAGHKADHHLKEVRLLQTSGCPHNLQGMHAGIGIGKAIAAAVNKARDLSNMPANYCTPSFLAEEALRVAAASNGRIETRVFKHEVLYELGAHALLAVSRGSVQPAVLIEMTYTPEAPASKEVLALVGKSITFDSGGLDIKTSAGMHTMKRDMSGGAAVLSAIEAIAALGVPLTVKAVMAAAENMPGCNAYKPGDVINSMAGYTIEIDDTDAEGRVTLADAIEYAKRQGATKIVDVATLTGAIRSYGADVGAGAFGNDPSFTKQVLEAAEYSGERLGELPMWDEFKSLNDSDMADIKNLGGDPGSITAALFLAKFAGDTSWVHLDIAGPSYRTRELGPDPKGATGYSVRTLIELARHMAGCLISLSE